MNTKAITERLEIILDDFVDEIPVIKPECDAMENYLSQIFSIMESEYLVFPAYFLKNKLSKDACFVFGLLSHIYFTDEDLRYGIGVFRISVAAEFLNMTREALLSAINEMNVFSDGKLSPVQFELEGELVFFRQKL